MLNFCSLYSGSTGNCLLVSSEDTNILIDAGVSQKKVIESLESLNININNINAILVTHEHVDHIMSVGGLSKKYDIPVYSNVETFSAMGTQSEKISDDNKKTFEIDSPFSIGSLNIEAFSIPHDAINPCGFNITKDNKKISIATDIGHMNNSLLDKLKNSSFIMLESNYDPEILKVCRYPYKLKQRISGLNGHLSNSSAGKTISALIPTGLNKVMLGHLSKENNFPELAYSTVLEEIKNSGFSKNNVHIEVASRNNPSNLMKII